MRGEGVLLAVLSTNLTLLLSSVSSELQAGTESFTSLARTSEGCRLNKLIYSDSMEGVINVWCKTGKNNGNCRCRSRPNIRQYLWRNY